MNRTIISTYSDQIGELYALTLPNKEAYAKKHSYGLDIVHFSDAPGGYGIGFKDYLNRVFETLLHGEGVMMMDADAVFTNLSIAIEEKIWGIDSVVAAHEPDPYCPMNGGVVLLNPVPRALNYVQLLVERFSEWCDDPLVPQGWICKNMDHPTIMSSLRIVDPSDMNALPEERPGYPHKNPGDLWKPGDWIAHAYGFPIPQKIELLRKVMNERP